MVLTKLSQRIARTPGDPKVLHTGPSSLTSGDKLARALAMFSFGLGAAEIVAPKRISSAIGLEGKEGLIRAYGLREISAGIPTFSIDKQVGLVMRILGDGLDIATVIAAFNGENTKRGRAACALAMLLGITALDVLAAVATTAAHRRSPSPPRDYSDRSGFPRGIDASRGLARKDFETPPDLHSPGPLAEQLPA